MHDSHDKLLGEVASYYSAKLDQHGQTARGVDWNGEASQWQRFAQLARLFEGRTDFSLNDLGCGYGALLDYLATLPARVDYLGIDVSADMIAAAKQRYADAAHARFTCAATPARVADFGVASGIFNLRMGRTDAQWRAYLEDTLDTMDATCRAGFAFNCLTSYSDPEKMRDTLYYADPCVLFDLCKRRYATQVALLHDYGLYEFTLLVRKPQ
ncbi:MAG: class I SAM-dependent methyltransferase [Burkholderiaceae bacterium]